MFESGMIIQNRYEIIEEVGSGGMSIVYKAKCHVLNRYVAMKVLKPEFADDKSFVNKFRIEAQSAAGLSHPNIVNVYDVGEENGFYYIVMELVEGITLKEYIQQNGRLPYQTALDFITQITSRAV
jgi:serine/threonine-protein kinase